MRVMRSWLVIGAVWLAMILLMVVACELAGAKSDKRVHQEPELSVKQDTSGGGNATSIVFQFVQGYAGALSGGFGMVVLLLLMWRLRVNAAIVERLVVAIEKADDGKVKQAVQEATWWKTGGDPIERTINRRVRKLGVAKRRIVPKY